MEAIEKAAEILVECGYAESLRTHAKGEELKIPMLMWFEPEIDNTYQEIDPFTDTLEGRRQADAIEDWLVSNHKKLWLFSMNEFGFDDSPKHQWRLDRIKWCLEQLVEGV